MPVPQDAVTVAGVTAEILAEHYAKGESLLEGPPYREIEYLVAWDDSDTFMDGLLGLVRTSGGVTTRTPPHQYPGNGVLWCVRVEGKPLGAARPDLVNERLYASDWCVVRAVYTVPIMDVAGTDTSALAPGMTAQPYMSVRMSGGTRIVQVPQQALLNEQGENPSRPVPRRVLLERIAVEFFAVPYLDPTTYRLKCKHSNDAVMFGWNPECVLFDEYDFTKVINWDGSYNQNIALMFLGQPFSWNAVPKEEDEGWTKVSGATTPANLLYPTTDLSGLILAPA